MKKIQLLEIIILITDDHIIFIDGYAHLLHTRINYSKLFNVNDNDNVLHL